MSVLEQVVASYQERPKTAILMSGAGSNAIAILSSEKLRDLYDFVGIVSDNSSSNGNEIASQFKVPAIIRHQERFNTDIERKDYFDNLTNILTGYGARAVIYAGFMKVASQKFCDTFPGVNVHPADLTIMSNDGLPMYRGMKALPAMRADMGIIRSTVHVVDNPVDSGAAISLSEVLIPPASMPDSDAHYVLKKKEHAVFSLTLELLGLGELNPSNMPYEYEQLRELQK